MAHSFFTSRHNRSLCRLLCRGEALTTNEKVTVMGSSMCLITYFYIHGEETKMEGNSGRRSAEWMLAKERENGWHMKFSRIRLIVKDTFIQFSPQKRKNKMMHNTLDREGGSRKYILLVLGTFCTQCTKFKIVPYDILRCAHRTRCCECAHTIFRLIRNVNCIFRREHGTWNTWIYFLYRIGIDCKKRHLVYKTVVMKWIKVEHYLYKTYKVCVPTIFYSYFSSICIFPSFLFSYGKGTHTSSFQTENWKRCFCDIAKREEADTRPIPDM